MPALQHPVLWNEIYLNLEMSPKLDGIKDRNESNFKDLFSEQHTVLHSEHVHVHELW